jgi:hypothetical protein
VPTLSVEIEAYFLCIAYFVEMAHEKFEHIGVNSRFELRTIARNINEDSRSPIRFELLVH